MIIWEYHATPFCHRPVQHIFSCMSLGPFLSLFFFCKCPRRPSGHTLYNTSEYTYFCEMSTHYIWWWAWWLLAKPGNMILRTLQITHKRKNQLKIKVKDGERKRMREIRTFFFLIRFFFHLSIWTEAVIGSRRACNKWCFFVSISADTHTHTLTHTTYLYFYKDTWFRSQCFFRLCSILYEHVFTSRFSCCLISLRFVSFSIFITFFLYCRYFTPF